MYIDDDNSEEVYTDNYTSKIEIGDLYTIEEFISMCKAGAFNDYDGYGNPVKNNRMNTDVSVYPSEIDKIPSDVTHIVWFNK